MPYWSRTLEEPLRSRVLRNGSGAPVPPGPPSPADLLVPEKRADHPATPVAEGETQVVGGTPITHQRRPGRSGPPL